MGFGAYFVPKREWDDARQMGLDWVAWPPIVPDSKGTGEGFVAERVIVDLQTGRKTPYPEDEVPNPKRLKAPTGSFITLGRRELGANARDLDPKYERAIVNYFLSKEPYWRTVEAGVLCAHRCAEAWKGTKWTAVVNANWGGMMDAFSEEQTVPVWLLVEQIDWYRELGASRIFWWRWDTPKGRVGIDAVMTRVQRMRDTGGLYL